MSCDVSGNNGSWLYSQTVKDHFFAPRNLLLDESDFKFDGFGQVGSPECGDVMVVWIKVKNNRVSECKWRTFGCASAIASASMMSVIATENGGLTLEQAKILKPQTIIERLGGLPERKFHCSVLGHEALRLAVEDYLSKHSHA